MKKRDMFIIMFAILLLTPLIHSQPVPPIPGDYDKITQFGKEISSENRTDYLKKQWGELLNKSEFFGPLIRSYEKISPVIDPVSRYTIGMEPSLSWLFALTLVIWICFLVYIYRILSIFSTFSDSTAFVIAFCLTIILSLMKIISLIANKIIEAISIITTWWAQLILVLVFIIAFALASVFSKSFKDWAEELKKGKAEQEEKENREKLQEIKEQEEKRLKEINKALED
jgi:ABC-type multidrug transport system fused ATPase/permease subunit